ncbi:MAG: RrF2 family transcriptional regulator [Lachnospiraceae bacterium]|nr:RrF2 family transcriptional regulator [Lachnospiraceae bacterium]
MKISTKGRYALKVMIDLAQHNDGTYISIKEIAERQEVSTKYLEAIVGTLNRAGFVESQRGKSGGYRLAKSPELFTVGAILKISEGSLSPVSCLDSKDGLCEKAGECVSLPLWRNLDKVVDDYLESVTLKGLLEMRD